MDWNFAIERNTTALLRIVAALISFVGLNADGDPAPTPATLPRHLYRAALLVLGPAEAALRRLIVVVAREVVVVLSAADRERITRAALTQTALPSRTGIFLRGRLVAPEGLKTIRQSRSVRGRPCARSFALFDPLKRFGLSRNRPSQWEPRIVISFDRGIPAVQPVRKPVSADDRIDAQRLCERLAAFKSALDDLPGQAQRLARWRARRGLSAGRVKRLSPLRPGLPPGHRQRPVHEVDTVLRHCHGLAIEAGLSPNTS